MNGCAERAAAVWAPRPPLRASMPSCARIRSWFRSTSSTLCRTCSPRSGVHAACLPARVRLTRRGAPHSLSEKDDPSLGTIAAVQYVLDRLARTVTDPKTGQVRSSVAADQSGANGTFCAGGAAAGRRAPARWRQSLRVARRVRLVALLARVQRQRAIPQVRAHAAPRHIADSVSNRHRSGRPSSFSCSSRPSHQVAAALTVSAAVSMMSDVVRADGRSVLSWLQANAQGDRLVRTLEGGLVAQPPLASERCARRRSHPAAERAHAAAGSTSSAQRLTAICGCCATQCRVVVSAGLPARGAHHV
jgi:hypothetical protein